MTKIISSSDFGENKMLFPIIIVKDTDSSKEHIVGTDIHDHLYIDDNGRLAYYNLQNSGGLDDWYKFKGIKHPNQTFPWPEIKMVTFTELKKINDNFHTKSISTEELIDIAKLKEERRKGIKFDLDDDDDF